MEKSKSTNIEKLISDGKLADAHNAFAAFLRRCEEEMNKLVFNQGRLSSLEIDKLASITGTEMNLERNRIVLNFQTQLDAFRKEVLSQYFDIQGAEAFFEGMTSRDAVINEILDLRLRPKRYLREEKLEEGNSSIIFRLLNPDTKRHAIAMVLKMPTLSDDLKKEIERLTDLRHRNIIKLLDHELGSFPFFIITEYVFGVKLPDAIASTGPRPVSQTADWLYQLAESLDYLRHKRILHTNVRPSKIYIDDEWQIMISPFDMYKVSYGEHTFNRYLDVCQYGSPELLEKDGRGLGLEDMCISDQYSLGLIGYKILTGNDLFSGISVFDIINDRNKFVKDKKYRKEKLALLPNGDLTKLIIKMLEENPNKRFRDLHTVLRALHPMTRVDQKNASPVRKSYRRCLASNKEFIRDFYVRFQAALGHEKNPFTPMGLKRQTAMLQMAVDVLLDVEERKIHLEDIIGNSKHSGLGYAEYQVFLAALLDTVKENDPLWHELQEIEKDWNLVLDKSLAVIKEKLDKTVTHPA